MTTKAGNGTYCDLFDFEGGGDDDDDDDDDDARYHLQRKWPSFFGIVPLFVSVVWGPTIPPELFVSLDINATILKWTYHSVHG